MHSMFYYLSSVFSPHMARVCARDNRGGFIAQNMRFETRAHCSTVVCASTRCIFIFFDRLSFLPFGIQYVLDARSSRADGLSRALCLS